jgi:hypothetical protein
MVLGVEAPEATALLGVGSNEVETVIPFAPLVALPMVKPEGKGGRGGGEGVGAGGNADKTIVQR